MSWDTIGKSYPDQNGKVRAGPQELELIMVFLEFFMISLTPFSASEIPQEILSMG